MKTLLCSYAFARARLARAIPILGVVLVLAVGCNRATPDKTETAEPRPPNAGPNAGRPNIVFILIDDLGWADLPVYGHAFHETPAIDRLAAQGLRFTHAYTAAPLCSPTRASIQSGQYPARVGVTDFIPGKWRPYERLTVPKNRTQHLPLEVVTVGEAMKMQGYATAYFGKWHLGSSRTGTTPAAQGYEVSFYQSGPGHFDLADNFTPPQEVEPDDYYAEVITDHGLAFMEAHRDQPFFLTLSHYAVHIPLEARQELIDKYENKEKPAEGVNNPIYAAMVEHVDQSVGRVLDTLDELELSQNTVVVFYSDNGGLSERYDKADGVVMTTNAPLREEKGGLWEGGIRVPLLVRWPGVVAPGGTSDALLSSVDLFPTFIDLAGGTMPEGQTFDGISMVPVLRGAVPDAERTLFFHYPHYHHTVPAGAIRQGDFKLLEFFDDGHTELYNLREDIGEAHDLAEEMPEKAAAMQTLLAEWRDEVGAAMPVANPDFDEARRNEWGRHPDSR